MADVVAHSLVGHWKKALANGDSTAASFSTTVPVETVSPNSSGTAAALLTTDGFWQLSGVDSICPSNIVVAPYATTANDVTASLRVWGWNTNHDITAGGIWYIPTLLIEVAYTAGNIASTLGTSWFRADTITLTSGDSTSRIYSYTNDKPGQFMLNMAGSRYVYFDFAINSGTATAMNALWRPHS